MTRFVVFITVLAVPTVALWPHARHARNPWRAPRTSLACAESMPQAPELSQYAFTLPLRDDPSMYATDIEDTFSNGTVIRWCIPRVGSDAVSVEAAVLHHAPARLLEHD